LDPEQYRLNKKQVRNSFNKAAAVYDEAAVLQHEVCRRLLERLEYIKAEPGVILDIGAGTGQGSIGLAAQYPDADIISLDLAENMLLQMRNKIHNQGLVKKLSNWFGQFNKAQAKSLQPKREIVRCRYENIKSSYKAAALFIRSRLFMLDESLQPKHEIVRCRYENINPHIR